MSPFYYSCPCSEINFSSKELNYWKDYFYQLNYLVTFFENPMTLYMTIFKTPFSLIVYAYDNTIPSFINIALYVVSYKVR